MYSSELTPSDKAKQELNKGNLKDFNLLTIIGKGLFANVIQAKHRQTEKIFALKVLNKSTMEDEEDFDCVRTEKLIFTKVSGHPFFVDSVKKLEKRQVTPPFKSEVQNERDLSRFDTLFTSETPILSPVDPKKIAKIDQSKFEGFEFVNS